MKTLPLLTALLLASSALHAGVPVPEGLWQLDDSLANDRSGGAALTAQNFTVAYADDALLTHPARVLAVPSLTVSNRVLILPTPGGGNGGGSFVNNYSVVMDLKVPALHRSAGHEAGENHCAHEPSDRRLRAGAGANLVWLRRRARHAHRGLGRDDRRRRRFHLLPQLRALAANTRYWVSVHHVSGTLQWLITSSTARNNSSPFPEWKCK